MTKFLKNVDVTGYVSQTSVTSSLVKTDSSGKLVAAVAGTDYATPGALASADKMVTIGRNATGATLYQGTVVYILGSTGNRPNFVKAQANGEATSAGTFGVVLADIPNNSDGNVVTIGAIDNLDTRSGATNPFTSDTLADGDTIYLHPTIAGYVTNIKPSAPNHLVYVGKVVRTSPTNGTIVYRIQNGYELDEIHDVAISSLANNHTLVWESATSLWKNKTIAATLGYTPADDAAVVKLTGYQTVAGVKTFTSVVNAPTLSLNGGVLAGNNIVSMRSNPTGGQFRIEKSDGSLSAYPFYIGADGTALAYYYNAAGALKVLLHTDGTSYFGNNLSVGYTTYAATTYKLDVNGTARVVGPVLANAPSEGATGEGLIAGQSFKIDATATGQRAAMYVVSNVLSDTYASGLQAQYANFAGDKGFGFNLNTAGGFELYVKNTSWNKALTIANTKAATFTDTVTATSFIKTGGTSAQFLKADGSVDSSTYLTSSSLSGYLPLTGGTLTGALTIGPLDGQVLKLQSATSIGSSYLRFYNSAGASRGYFGLFWSGTADYMVLDAGATQLNFGSSNSFTFTGGGGATFSSSVNVQNFLSVSSASTLVAPSSGKSIEMVYRTDGANDYAFIQTYDRTNSVFKQLRITGSTLILNEGGTNVGIGTISPSKTLHVYTTSNEGIFLQGTSGGVWMNIQSAAGNLWSIGAQNDGMGIYNRTSSLYAFFIKDNRQLQLAGYTASSSYTGTAAGYLAFDSSGNVITVAGVAATDNTKLPLAGGALTGPLTITGNGSYLGNWGYKTLELNDTSGYPGIFFKNGNNIWIMRSNGADNGFDWAYSTNASAQGTGTFTQKMRLATDEWWVSTYPNYKMRIFGGDVLESLNGTSATTLYLQYHSNTGGNVNIAASKFIFYNTGTLAMTGVLQMSTSGTSYISMGRFPNSVSNSGEAWLGRAADRSSGSMTVQLGGSSNASFFEVVDYGWTTVTLRAGMNEFSYKGNAVIHAGNIGSQSVSYASSSGNSSTTSQTNFSDLSITGSAHKYLTINPGNGYEAMVRYVGGGSGSSWYVGKRTSGQLIGTESFHFYSEQAGATVAGINPSGTMQLIGTVYAASFRGNANQAGTGEAVHAPAGIYSTGNNWLYGNIMMSGYSLSGANTISGSGLITGGTLRSNTNVYIDQNYGHGVVGLYNSTVLQGVFAMGDAYKLTPGGGAGSLYGLAWSHPNAGGVASNLNTHGLLVMENGTFLAAISGSIRARDDMRAPAIYDSGNRVAISRGEGRNYVDYSRYVYNNGAYSGSGWIEPSDLGVRYAASANYASSAGSLSGFDKTNPSFGAVYASNWFRAQGDCGLYSQDYGGHIRRALTGSFGNWETFGYNRNGWSGFLNLNNYNLNLMMNSSGDKGFYQENGRGWTLFFNYGNNCWGIGTDNTYSGDGFRCIKYGSAEYGWTTWSDRRAKENIKPIVSALDTVLGMRGVYYNYIKDEAKVQRVGFIAQELMEVLPQAVRYAEEIDEYNVNYDQIVSVLAEAIKEQNAEITQLKLLVTQLINR